MNWLDRWSAEPTKGGNKQLKVVAKTPWQGSDGISQTGLWADWIKRTVTEGQKKKEFVDKKHSPILEDLITWQRPWNWHAAALTLEILKRVLALSKCDKNARTAAENGRRRLKKLT